MAKQVTARVKVQAPGGQATPAPPIGTALGPHGIAINEFVRKFNEQTAHMQGTIVPAVVTIYRDRSFEFILKTPPAAVLLKKAANIAQGSGVPNKEKVGSVTRQQVREIAQMKTPDLNASSVEAAMRVIEGTARSMGIEIRES